MTFLIARVIFRLTERFVRGFTTGVYRNSPEGPTSVNVIVKQLANLSSVFTVYFKVIYFELRS